MRGQVRYDEASDATQPGSQKDDVDDVDDVCVRGNN